VQVFISKYALSKDITAAGTVMSDLKHYLPDPRRRDEGERNKRFTDGKGEGSFHIRVLDWGHTIYWL